jgi:aminopeptidase N
MACTGGGQPRPTSTGCPDLGAHPGARGLGDLPFPDLGNGGYEVARYTIDLEIDPEPNRVSARVAIEANATEVLTGFSLDYTGPAIERIEVDGRPAQSCRAGAELLVAAPSTIGKGTGFTASITYEGSPHLFNDPDSPGPRGWVPLSDGGLSVAGLYGAASSWCPLNDTPRDKALYTLRLTTPMPLVAVGGGVLREKMDHGSTTTSVWETQYPVWPDDGAAFVVDAYPEPVVISELPVPIGSYVPESVKTDVSRDLDPAAAMIDFFEGLFGPYPFDFLDFVFVPGGPIPLFEGQGRSFWNGEARSSLDLAHHIAHQWFEHAVNPATFHDVWLREGFATYAELLWLEHDRGMDTRDSRLRIFSRLVGQQTNPLIHSEDPSDLRDPDLLFGRPALALHALRLEIGDEAFFQVVRTYVERFRFSTPTTADFISTAQEVSGRDLASFFHAWLEEEAVPPIPQLSAGG